MVEECEKKIKRLKMTYFILQFLNKMQRVFFVIYKTKEYKYDSQRKSKEKNGLAKKIDST